MVVVGALSDSSPNTTPIRIRKLKASIFSVGLPSTNRLMGSGDNSITSAAMMTALTMTPLCSAMPTAVITESSEKTTSTTMICRITERRLAGMLLHGVPAYVGSQLYRRGRQCVDPVPLAQGAEMLLQACPLQVGPAA